MSYQTFSRVFSRLVEKSNYSDAEVARRLSVNRSTISRWKSGEQSPALSKIKEIADLLEVNPMVFVDDSQEYSNKVAEKKESYIVTPVKGSSSNVPLYGSVAAGQPLEMIQIEDLIEIPESVAFRYPNSFLLRVNGDSMNKIVPNGAYALIDPCEDANNGEIVAVAVNGYDATLKHFFKLQNSIALEPDSYNPEHVARVYTGAEATTIKVIGKMVWYMAPLDAKF
ncbi:LexA family protein [Paenibacillus medicaginis]|uniref:LexA family protein n=1 Tax=Paenibacillus medicaginis TaxID=1470560 RepID=A0ABV5C0X0_9BACL